MTIAQLSPPSLRCLEVLNNGDIRLTWVPVSDPTGQFFSYEIYSSVNSFGPYALVGNITSLPVNQWVHNGALGNLQSRYYYMVTRYGPGGTNMSKSSDTLRSLFLTLANIGNGIAQLSVSQLKNPPLPSTAPTYTVFREYPLNIFNPLVFTSNYWYNDTVDICSVIYNYQFRITDQYGCISTSQVTGDFFHDKTPPHIPSFDSVSVDENNQALLGWKATPNPDAIKYFIYVKDLTSGIVTKIDSVPVSSGPFYSFTSPLPSLQSVAFHVATLDSCRNISPLNTYHQSIFLQYSYDICSGKVILNWNPYENFKNGVVSGYDIYMSLNNGPYQIVGSTLQTQWTSPVLQSNQHYRFYVRAWNVNRILSSSSNRISFYSYTPAAPSFVYISSCSILSDSTALLSIYRDSLARAKDMDILRSEDGLNFSTVAVLSFQASGHLYFHDTELKNKKGSLYYKAVLKDSCNNPRVASNLVQSIWLKVKSDHDELFVRKLEWSPYSGFAAGVGYYDVYRKSGGKTEWLGHTASVHFEDNIEQVAQDGTDIFYYVKAHESAFNTYQLQDSASSVWARAYATDDFFIPNAFAPNGLNKTWKPVPFFVMAEGYELTVLNRWGHIVFRTRDLHENWNGGNEPAGMYIFHLRYKTTAGEHKEKSGHVMLLR